MNGQTHRKPSLDLLPRNRKSKADLPEEPADGPPRAAHRPMISPKRLSRLSIKSFHRSRSYSATQSLEEEARKSDDVFTSPSETVLQDSLAEEEKLSLDPKQFLTPAEASLAVANRKLDHHGLMGLATGEEIRPDLKYSGKWEFDEDLAKQHSQWIGRDARARDVILHAFKGVDNGDGFAGYTDARQMWETAETAAQTSVSNVAQSLLSWLNDYATADQVCRELESLNAQIQSLGPAVSPELLLVLFAYNSMHSLDQLIFRKSLTLFHPSSWCLSTLRHHEILWDSVFDELFDLESDWSFSLNGEAVIITIKEANKVEEYCVGAETLINEFRRLAFYGYDEWLKSHPTHFQKCDASCPNRKSASGIHYRNAGDPEPTVKQVADTLSKRVLDGDMDHYRPPGKRAKDEAKRQTNGISPVTPVKLTGIT